MAEISCYRLTPIFYSPSPSVQGWEAEESGNEGVKLSQRGNWGRGYLLFGFLAINEINCPKSCFFFSY